MLSILDVSLFAGLGLLAGTLAGLFGIGGGMVIVPGLFYLFQVMALSEASAMHLAVGSSMGIMIFTAIASTWSHHRRGDVQWGIVGQILPAIAVGVLTGKGLAHNLSAAALEICFGLFLLFVSLKMLLNWLPTPEEPSPPRFGLTALVGIAVGFKSGVLGIGGGAISVPFLLYSGFSMGQASGTSSAFTLPIALIGTLLCVTLTIPGQAIPGTLGTVYWPAVALVAPFTMLGAPLGTRLCHVVPAQRLKRLFALFLLFVGGRLLWGQMPLA
ncbi:sulfite exporter TauE/SafE family protein [Leptolyngbya sp. PCC 6406]|uniref:sulfite exporter TauE/SafE family protein n=1 Tax=Leptolyngbya sp. PCC 6406 TaxID=1173264 RepID=UPI0002ABFF8B|nr:sulfite exporter TauE/SafE family protein [Leptolyngbya sp. PCC 6406]